MRYIVIVFVSIIHLSLFSQSVLISGHAENQNNSLVRLICYDDNFSLLEKTLVSEITDDKGKFSLETEISNTKLILIALNLEKAELFVEPDEAYNLVISSDSANVQKSIYEQSPLNYEYSEEGGINSVIQEFNLEYNTFLLDNFNAIYRSRNNSLIDNFKAKSDSVYGDFHNDYFVSYRRYRMASLELATRRKKENVLLKEYFLNDEILYDNIEYAYLFKEVFSNYLTSGDGGIDYSKLVEVINMSTNFKKLDELISSGNNLLSSDERLRELIGIVGLAKLYKIVDFKRDNVIKYMRQIERNSVYKEHRKIAANYISVLLKLTYGTIAPPIQLKDIDGVLHNLADFSGEFVLLSFMDENCQACFEQITLIDELRQMFKSKLEMMTLINGNSKAFYNYMYERDYEWPLVEIDNLLLLEDYDIKVSPTFILINPDGSIAMAPTPMPEENLAGLINGFMKRWERER